MPSSPRSSASTAPLNDSGGERVSRSQLPGTSNPEPPKTQETDMAKTATRGIDLEPIDRLEEKVKALVAMVERMKSEQARVAEDNQRLSRELDTLRARLASSDGVASELSALKNERDVIRGRVSEMLEQLEALNL
jgi:regulator of replication initiation timing